MKRFSAVLVGSLAVAIATSAASAQGRGDQRQPPPQQQQQQHRANGGHVPPPPPVQDRGRGRGGRPTVETYPGGQVDARPHVSNNVWYGHDVNDDARYRLPKPYARGRFARVGPSVQYRISRFDAPSHRFWFAGGLGFEVASWDWPFASGWCWSCPDDIVVYDDPDHTGWYLIYNTETGVYVHAQYIGR